MFWFRIAALAATSFGVLYADEPGQADGTTPLAVAVYNDDLAAAQRLLRTGADAKAANRYGFIWLPQTATRR